MQEVVLEKTKLGSETMREELCFSSRPGCAVCPSSQGKSLSRNRPSTGHPSVDVQLKNTSAKNGLKGRCFKERDLEIY